MNNNPNINSSESNFDSETENFNRETLSNCNESTELADKTDNNEDDYSHIEDSDSDFFINNNDDNVSNSYENLEDQLQSKESNDDNHQSLIKNILNCQQHELNRIKYLKLQNHQEYNKQKWKFYEEKYYLNSNSNSCESPTAAATAAAAAAALIQDNNFLTTSDWERRSHLNKFKNSHPNYREALEIFFESKKYPNDFEKRELAERLNVKINQINTWFHHKRAKYRSQNNIQIYNVFSPNVKKELEQFYTNTQYPCEAEKRELATGLGLTLIQVNNWFSNKRKRNAKKFKKINEIDLINNNNNNTNTNDDHNNTNTNDDHNNNNELDTEQPEQINKEIFNQNDEQDGEEKEESLDENNSSLLE
jgi:hypothetical protein